MTTSKTAVLLLQGVAVMSTMGINSFSKTSVSLFVAGHILDPSVGYKIANKILKLKKRKVSYFLLLSKDYLNFVIKVTNLNQRWRYCLTILGHKWVISGYARKTCSFWQINNLIFWSLINYYQSLNKGIIWNIKAFWISVVNYKW